MLIFDAHLDLSMCAVEWNRDLTRSVQEVRRREAGMTDKRHRGNNTVTLPELRRAGIGLCVATQFGRYVSEDNPRPGWHSPEIAWAYTQAQLAWYRTMEEAGQMVQIVDAVGLSRHVELWKNDPPADAPVGYILSLEGADSIVRLDYLERAYEYGLRALGPAHYGPGRYAPGTDSTGGLEPAGRELVKQMQRLGIILDVTHLTDEGFWEALELYDGPVWASHNNCRALVPHQRQFSDEQLQALIQRGAVIGIAYDAWMLHTGWEKFKTMPQDTGLKIEHSADHIDHICQLAGTARHCGIGSDLDGGFGNEQTPTDLDTIADLRKLITILADRGYSPDDIEAIMHGNWLRFLAEAWGGVKKPV